MYHPLQMMPIRRCNHDFQIIRKNNFDCQELHVTSKKRIYRNFLISYCGFIWNTIEFALPWTLKSNTIPHKFHCVSPHFFSISSFQWYKKYNRYIPSMIFEYPYYFQHYLLWLWQYFLLQTSSSRQWKVICNLTWNK